MTETADRLCLPAGTRLVRPEDADAWLRMRRALWPDEPGEHEREIAAFFAGSLREPQAVVVAEGADGGLVGFAELSLRTYAEGCETSPVGYLEGWYVAPGARRQGVGRSLVRAGEIWALAQGCSEFASDTEVDNEASAAAHRALGFDQVDVVRCFRKRLEQGGADGSRGRSGAPAAWAGACPPFQLDCGPCIVREWRADDREALVRLADNRNVWRNLSHRFPHPYTAADADAWFAFLAAMPEPTHWAIEVDGAVAGGIGVILGEGVYGKSAELGYWLGEPYWGRGLATAAARAAAPAAMARFGLVRLEARVYAWNVPSMRVLEKSGFTREVVLRRSVVKDGELIDAVLYARLR